MEDEYDQVEIPCYFLCPISLQLMKDPVTVSTGITYDRNNIEKWIFRCSNATCPITKQPLPNTDLTPNHTLRRLIQALPKPSPILNLLAQNSPISQRLKSISSNRHLQATGAVDFLLSIVGENNDDILRDEALSLLPEFELSDSDLKSFFSDDGRVLDTLLQVLQTGSFQNRALAIILLKSALSVSDPPHLTGSKPEVFIQTIRILQDKISQRSTKAALKLLIDLCPWGKNRIKAAQYGAVSTLIELLLETSDRTGCELVLILLDQLCRCAEGRAELLKHGAGLAVVSKKILRVSGVGSDKGVRILRSVSRHSANSRVLQEMVQVGVVSKLCLVVQVEKCDKTKEKAKEILRLHSRVWKDSSCIPPHLLSSYPPS